MHPYRWPRRGEAGQQQQQPKRKLLPVTTSYAAAGDALPTDMLFGGAFKVPRLAK